MADIRHRFLVHAPKSDVFAALSTPQGLDMWWTKRSSGEPVVGHTYQLWFSPAHDWQAVVRRCVPDAAFALELTSADADWTGTRVAFELEQQGETTHVRFDHTGWPTENDHYHASTYCWAMYLRLLNRYVEHGEVVPYEERLEV
jgi:uncharacterized protein YndB with AHSA1/START domain